VADSFQFRFVYKFTLTKTGYIELGIKRTFLVPSEWTVASTLCAELSGSSQLLPEVDNEKAVKYTFDTHKN